MYFIKLDELLVILLKLNQNVRKSPKFPPSYPLKRGIMALIQIQTPHFYQPLRYHKLLVGMEVQGLGLELIIEGALRRTNAAPLWTWRCPRLVVNRANVPRSICSRLWANIVF